MRVVGEKPIPAEKVLEVRMRADGEKPTPMGESERGPSHPRSGVSGERRHLEIRAIPFCFYLCSSAFAMPGFGSVVKILCALCVLCG
jgi:hypothetical protein